MKQISIFAAILFITYAVIHYINPNPYKILTSLKKRPYLFLFCELNKTIKSYEVKMRGKFDIIKSQKEFIPCDHIPHSMTKRKSWIERKQSYWIGVLSGYIYETDHDERFSGKENLPPM